MRVTRTSLSVPILNLDSTSLLSIVLGTLREATCLQSFVFLDGYSSTVQGLLDWSNLKPVKVYLLGVTSVTPKSTS